MAADATGEPVTIDARRFIIVDLRIPCLMMFFIKAALAAVAAAIVVGFLLMVATSTGDRHPAVTTASSCGILTTPTDTRRRYSV